MNISLTRASLLFGLTAAATISQVLPASAFTGYTDRAAWEAAIGSFETEVFDGNSINQTMIDFGDFTITGEDNDLQGGFVKVDATPAGRESVKFTFDNPIQGFFADWGTLLGNERVGPQVDIVGDFDGTGMLQTINLWSQLPATGRQRSGPFGLIGDAMFSEFEVIRNTGNSPDNLSVDDFSYGPQAVPEPMSILGLLTLGAVAAGSTLKKKAMA
ncbi:MAG: PEP-CTERM sorting domain-containing protein [Leptolyngbya sp. SIOISBB]|nr:PEP-CTERM sorting domain-containing protein [Leptolyngbya sp. SIOISBB]